MELRQLRYLLEVAAAGSISRAADKLCIAQSAVSRQIADLEAELGVVLLLRQRGGGVLTDAGQRFVEGSAEILASLDALRASVSATQVEPQRLRVGVPPTVSPILLTLFSRELPGADLPLRPTVIEGSSHWLRQRLDTADLDCAILTNPLGSRALHVEFLWQENLFLVGAAASPWASEAILTVRDLQPLPLALTPRGDPSREAIEAAFAMNGVSPDVRHEHEAVTLVRELIARGVTCSILSQTMVQSVSGDPALAAVPIQGLTIGRSLAVRRGSLPKDLIERLARRIREAAERHFARNGWIGPVTHGA